MRIVVVGASGRIGAGVVTALAEAGHEVIAASRRNGVDAVTGAGLAAALAGADAVVDVTRPSSEGDEEARAFFAAVTRNLIDTERAAGVAHHLALSVVGCDRVPDSGFLSAKAAQERLIADSGVPHTIIRATQFFEFLPHVADTVTRDGVARVPTGRLQPVAGGDVSAAIAELAVRPPLDVVVEVAGPEPFAMAELVRRVIAARGETIDVVADADARYFGTRLIDDELVPRPGARLGAMTFETWLAAHDLRT